MPVETKTTPGEGVGHSADSADESAAGCTGLHGLSTLAVMQRGRVNDQRRRQEKGERGVHSEPTRQRTNEAATQVY